MLKQLKRKEEGFTIIEVLIVLAIAGLIMVIVFLAVPALKRNAHNEQYKTEGNNILAAYQELSNNNGGSPLNVSSSITPGSDAANVLTAANAKSISNLNIIAYAASSAQTPPIGNAIIMLSATCQSQGNNTPIAGTSRQIAIVFQIESPTSTPQYQCVGS